MRRTSGAPTAEHVKLKTMLRRVHFDTQDLDPGAMIMKFIYWSECSRTDVNQEENPRNFFGIESSQLKLIEVSAC